MIKEKTSVAPGIAGAIPIEVVDLNGGSAGSLIEG
jgi:hypothetical protein